MSGYEYEHYNPSTFNFEYHKDIKNATKEYDLSNSQFNAVKHAGVSAVIADSRGQTAAHITGNLNEMFQDLIGSLSGNPNVNDDTRDIINNAIGREYASRHPNLSPDEYYKAMAELAKRGNLATDEYTKLPDFTSQIKAHHPSISPRSDILYQEVNYINQMTDRALDSKSRDVFPSQDLSLS